MTRTRLVSVGLLGWLGACAAAIRPPAAGATSQPPRAEIRAVWVDAFNPGIKTRAEIAQLVARAREAHLNTILAQVRRRGDSYYLDSAEPVTEDPASEPGLDALAELVAAAHAAGIEVHAWVIANAVYNGSPLTPTEAWPCRVPCDRVHVFNAHGVFAPGDENWLTRSHPQFTSGTLPVGDMVPAGWRTADGNWWLDPGHPAAAEYTVDVLRHLVSRYAIDGLHLDRIRYPEMPIARASATSPIGFSTGYNPVSVRRFNAAGGRAGDAVPDPWDPAWSAWRRAQMDALMRRIYLETIAIRNEVKVSAATITFSSGPAALGGFEATEAYTRVFQDWNGWMRHGWLDLNMPMVYKADHVAATRTQFADWSRFTADHQYGRQALIGIAAYLNSLENTIGQIERSRETTPEGGRAAGQALYSYATTNATAGSSPSRPHGELYRALARDGAYAESAPYAEAAPIPPMPWKLRPERGHLLARIVDGEGRAIDGAVVTLREIGAAAFEKGIEEQTADGNGFIGITDLTPGAYRLWIRTPAGAITESESIQIDAGRVRRVEVRP